MDAPKNTRPDTVAPSTEKKYTQALARLTTAGVDVENPTSVFKHLDDLKAKGDIKDSAYKVYLAALAYKFKKDNKQTPQVYVDKMRELAGTLGEKTKDQQLSDKQVVQYVPHKELVKIANELPMGVEKVVASLYTLTPPLRNNFGDMRVVDKINSKTPGNLLVMNKSKARYVMRNYKTSSSHGDVVIPLDKKAFAVLRDWFAHLGGKPEFLLGKEMSPTIVGRLIEDAFKATGKKVGVNILRHAYIKEHLPPIATNIRQKEALADKMLHSIAQQNAYYSLNVE